MKEEELKKDETLEDVFNGIIEEVDKKQMHFLIEKAKEKWIKQAKSEAIKEFEKLLGSQEVYNLLIKLMTNEKGLPTDNRIETACNIQEELKLAIKDENTK